MQLACRQGVHHGEPCAPIAGAEALTATPASGLCIIGRQFSCRACLAKAARPRAYGDLGEHGFSQRLELRQGQSLVMTPQLLQAIKLLQFSSLELAELCRGRARAQSAARAATSRSPRNRRPTERNEPEARRTLQRRIEGSAERAVEGDWRCQRRADAGARRDRRPGRHRPRQRLPDDRPARRSKPSGDQDGLVPVGRRLDGRGRRRPRWRRGLSASRPMSRPSSRCTTRWSEQLQVATPGPRRPADRHAADRPRRRGRLPRRAAWSRSPSGSACRWRGSRRSCALIQSFEPTGVGARNLAECLRLQLSERDRLRPGDGGAGRPSRPAGPARLRRRCKRLCGVDDEDLAEMVAEIRRLDPKPGRASAAAPIQPVVPDVYVRQAAGRRLARRAEHRRAAARAGQPDLLRQGRRARPRANRTRPISPTACRRRTG